MNMTPKGKIGRLGTALREEANRRLEHGEKAGRVAAWLNSLPEVQAMLAAEFKGKPINEVNLCHWRQFGYKNWLWRREAMATAHEIGELRDTGAGAGAAGLMEQMAGWAGVRYLMTVRALAEQPGAGAGRLKVLRQFCQDVVA